MQKAIIYYVVRFKLMSGLAVLFLRARDPEGEAGLDPGLTFTSIRTINAQPMFTTFQLIVHTYILLLLAMDSILQLSANLQGPHSAALFAA